MLATQSDQDIIAKQLGRKPQGKFQVFKRCSRGLPEVILTLPEKTKPFPTLFWLTCPLLVKKVSQLEDEGWVKGFQQQLSDDEKFRERYLEALRKRKKLSLSENVTGTKNSFYLKCLHAHLADYLALGFNPVGLRVLEKIGEFSCPQKCVDENFCH